MSYCDNENIYDYGFTIGQKERAYCWLNRVPRINWYEGPHSQSIEITGNTDICLGESTVLMASAGMMNINGI